MSKFSDKMAAFTAELRKQKSSDEVTKLTALIPYLLPYGTRNKVKGNVAGLVIQTGSTPDEAWSVAGGLVAAIGHKELSKRFSDALSAASEHATIRNTVDGNVTGTVIQGGNMYGGINIRRGQ